MTDSEFLGELAITKEALRAKGPLFDLLKEAWPDCDEILDKLASAHANEANRLLAEKIRCSGAPVFLYKGKEKTHSGYAVCVRPING